MNNARNMLGIKCYDRICESLQKLHKKLKNQLRNEYNIFQVFTIKVNI